MSALRQRPRIARHVVAAGSSAMLRLGFVPLIDAAPLIVAREFGFFADEGLDVRLDKQIGWSNVRDRLAYGELQASHAPYGMVPASRAGLADFVEPLSVLLELGSGGNAITVARPLADANPTTPSAARWPQRLGRPPTLAYVFSVASHGFALRQLLHSGGLDPNRDARLCILPPAQLSSLLGKGAIDGFCAGEPWNTLAVVEGSGTIICATTELFPAHPEKVLAVTRQWLEANASTAERLVRAVLRGCDICADVNQRGRLAEMLAAPKYLAVDERVIDQSLSIDSWVRPGVIRPPFRSIARRDTAPRVASAEWVIGQLVRWGQFPNTVDANALARECVHADAYAAATASLDQINHASPGEIATA